MTAPLYYEDLAVGQTFGTGSVTVEPEMIRAFAAEFDPQPFHLDEDAARGSLFGGLVASGWHTAALTMKLLVGGELKVVGGLIGMGVEELRWPRPVHPGDVLRVESEVLGLRPSKSQPDRGHRPGAEHDLESGRPAGDGPGRQHDRAPATVMTAAPASDTTLTTPASSRPTPGTGQEPREGRRRRPAPPRTHAECGTGTPGRR